MEIPKSSARIPRIPLWVLIALFLAYALPGNLGHNAWRGDDVQHINIAYEMLKSGDWLLPRIAGVSSTAWSPLPYWVGAITNLLFGWLLTQADSIRLFTLISLTLTIWPLRAAASRLFDKDAGNAVFFLALSSLGLIIHAHEAQPQMVLLAAFSCFLYGLVLLRERAILGGVISGFSLAASVLTIGLGGLTITLPLLVLLPALHPAYREKNQLLGLALSFVLSAVLIATWLIPLYLFEPTYFQAWLRAEIRTTLPVTIGNKRFAALLELLAWFAWPLWPITLWALWNRRKQVFSNIAYLFPLLALLCALWLIVTTGSLRPANMLPILPPLLLLAGGELLRLRRGATNAFNWFGIMAICFVGLFIWVAWSALHLGWPAPLGRNIMRLTQGFQSSWSFWELGFAVLISALWVLSIIKLPFSAMRGVIHWALGITLSWCLLAVLWQDWFNYDKNYAPVMAEIQKNVQQHSQTRCLVGLGTGDSQRAAFNYYTNLTVITGRNSQSSQCDMLIAYASGRAALPTPKAGWEKVWEKRKGSDRLAEKFALYRKVK